MASLSISLIQSLLYWEDKTANLRQFEEKISHLPEGTEIVILPEMFSTGFSMKPELLAEKMDGPTIAWMERVAASKKIILTGSIIIEADNAYYNRLIWMLPTGQCWYYDKRHLFAYAGENQHYSPGKRRLVASVKGWKINLQVCYDLRFPVWSRQQHHPEFFTDEQPSDSAIPEPDIHPEYDVLVYVANWPERRNHAWKTLLQARAIENQCYVIGVNRVGHDGNAVYHSGNSMVVDPLGETIYNMEHDEDIFSFTLQKEVLEELRTRFPFWKDADQFLIRSDS